MSSRLDNLTGHSGPLAAEPAASDEFDGLIKPGLARLNDGDMNRDIESRWRNCYESNMSLNGGYL